MDQSLLPDSAKAVPPAIVAAWNCLGLTVPDLINHLTLVYVVALVAQKGFQFYRFLRDRGHVG